MLLEKSYFLYDESNELGFDSGFSVTYSFPGFYLLVEESVIGILGSEMFAEIGVASIDGVSAFDVFIPTGVELKVG